MTTTSESRIDPGPTVPQPPPAHRDLSRRGVCYSAGIMQSTEQAGVSKRAGAVPLQPVAAGTATETQVLIGPGDGAPNFALRRFVMGEGGGMPRHTNAVEHEQFVLTGAARVTIGEALHEVQAGSALYIPAEVPHSYEVTEAPFEFLCIVPNREDCITLVEDSVDDS